jgi:sensor histidine kinase YesM
MTTSIRQAKIRCFVVYFLSIDGCLKEFMQCSFSKWGNKAQRYFFTLLVWNNLVGLFLTLAVHRPGGLNFHKLFFLVLVVSHITSLICLGATDALEYLVNRYSQLQIPFYVLAILSTTAVLVPALMVGHYVGTMVAKLLAIDWHPPFSMIFKHGLLFGAIVTLFNVMHAARVYRLELQFQREQELAAAKNRLLEARLDILSKELNPHLLFNLINSVLYVIHHDPNKAEKMLENIAVYYQKVLLIFEKISISLREELDLLRLYASLNDERICNFTLTINEASVREFGAFKIPPLLLQPLVENAIKHALVPLPKDSPKSIVIDISRSTEFLTIKIIDNGKVISKIQKTPPGLLVGLKNCRARVKEFFGDKAQIKLETLEQGTLVALELPHETT